MQPTSPVLPVPPPTIVGEVSASYVDGNAVSRPICEWFEELLAKNRTRGYELGSWQLSRVVYGGLPVEDGPKDSRVRVTKFTPVVLNETIVAVFHRVPDA